MLLALMKQLIGKLFPACHSMDNAGTHRTGAVVAAPEAAGSPKVDDMGMDLNDFAFRQSNGQSEYAVGILV